MAKTVRRPTTKRATVYYPTKRGRRAEVRSTRQASKRELAVYR